MVHEHAGEMGRGYTGIGGTMANARTVTHRAKKARPSAQEILMRRLDFFRAIPVYPMQISGKQLGDKIGSSIGGILGSLSSNVLVCEDDGMYCWPTEHDKKQTIYEYINMAGGSDFP